MLKVGSKAPAFTLNDQDGKKVSLKDLAGKWVVLYFYPKDLTPGCTQEACDFRDQFAEFRKKKAVILGVSKDDEKMHTKFIATHSLPFQLLADVDGKVCEKYGVWQEKSMYGRKYMRIARTTFVIDPAGKIAEIFEKVKVKGHSDAVLSAIK